MSDYRNSSLRLTDRGLNLRDELDKLQEGQWRVLHNTHSKNEAALTTRDGRGVFVTTASAGSVHSLKRVGDSALLIGAGTSLLVNSASLASSGAYSGNPLSLVPFRPSLSPSVWTYVGDSLQMRKVKEDLTDRKWGITSPPDPAIFAVGAAGNLNSSVAGAIVYDWRYTYYSTATGAESNPSPTADGIAVVAQQALIQVVASSDPQVDQIRLYRRGGTQATTWRLSVTGSNTTSGISDNNADSSIALAEAISLTNDVPFTTVSASGAAAVEVPLPYVAGPFLGKYLIACGDPNRPGYVYWTNSGNPDGASPVNNLQVTSAREPLIGTFQYGSQPYLWSRDNLWKLDFGSGSTVTFVPRLTACGKGLASPWAYCIGPLIYFLSTDGIYETNGDGEAVSLTEESLRPIFNGVTVGEYLPVDYTQTSALRLSYTGLELRFFYKDTAGTARELIYHTLYKRWRSASSTEHTATLAYEDENQSSLRVLLGATNGAVYKSGPEYTDDNGVAISAHARTGSSDFGIPQTFKEFGNIIVDAVPTRGGTVPAAEQGIVLTPYINAEATTLAPSSITGTGRQNTPISLLDTYAYSLALDFTWVGYGHFLYGATLLWRADEEALFHWECPDTDHGASGWQHARDAYICLRSSATVTLTLLIDGVAYTFTPPESNTSGAKRKVYYRLQPTKGKVYRYMLDSGSTFRLYGSECEVRVKPWNTSLSYKPVATPFEKMGAPPGVQS